MDLPITMSQESGIPHCRELSHGADQTANATRDRPSPPFFADVRDAFSDLQRGRALREHLGVVSHNAGAIFVRSNEGVLSSFVDGLDGS
ncbi:hypothetical protein [Streptomyces sp. NPDC042319]|uniref:hypothetical protein n=1 Tax=Streptomyces sp. NPDC042319 TaxID=3154332 RepID=UPI0033EA8642